MKAFTELCLALDRSAHPDEASTVNALIDYFKATPSADAAWSLYFFSGQTLKPLVSMNTLQIWAVETTGIADWLFRESYAVVGNLAETIALLLPEPAAPHVLPLHEWIEDRTLPLYDLSLADRRTQVSAAWQILDSRQRLVWNKLITGTLRIAIVPLRLNRALATLYGLELTTVARRLVQPVVPTSAFYASLIAPETTGMSVNRPYPFCVASDLMVDPESLGAIHDWQIEPHREGIRTQIIRRSGQTFVWSIDSEMLNVSFPELMPIGETLPDGTVLDGEILTWKAGHWLPRAQLAMRTGRRPPDKKLLATVPIAFMATDLLEYKAVDYRKRPLTDRRAQLELLLAQRDQRDVLLSPSIAVAKWESLAGIIQCVRSDGAQGITLKRLNAPYAAEPGQQDWWIWKGSPYTINAVLMYAQTDPDNPTDRAVLYTLGVWSGDQLVSVAKAVPHLTEAEISQIDRFIRHNTLERFGPVRTVKPALVFELAFQGIERSKRHRSGVVVHQPRIIRWHMDKASTDATSLERVLALLPTQAE